jgi:hypothetical protein
MGNLDSALDESYADHDPATVVGEAWAFVNSLE